MFNFIKLRASEKNTFFFYLLITFCFCQFSCTEESAVLEEIDELVVQGYLREGQAVADFRVTKIVSLATENNTTIPVNEAQVFITSEGTTYELTATGADGLYKNDSLIPEEGKTYELEVTFEDKTITATTFVPNRPENITVSETEVALQKVETFFDLDFSDLPEPIEVNWEDDNSNYYFVSVTNIEDDPEPVNELFGDGELPQLTNQPEITNTFFINSFQFFTFYGRYEVEVFRVNPEYVTLYENVSTGQGALNEVTTNVTGGFGIFTGVSSTTIEMNVVKL